METLTLEQVHEAGKNLRTQFKSLYDVLEAIDGIKSLRDLQTEAENATAKAKEELGTVLAELDRATGGIKSVEGKVAKMFQDAANGRTALREEAEAEAKKIREEAKAFLSKAQDEEGHLRAVIKALNEERTAADEYYAELNQRIEDGKAQLERIRDAGRALASS